MSRQVGNQKNIPQIVPINLEKYNDGLQPLKMSQRDPSSLQRCGSPRWEFGVYILSDSLIVYIVYIFTLQNIQMCTDWYHLLDGDGVGIGHYTFYSFFIFLLYYKYPRTFVKDCCCFFSSFTSYQKKGINKSFISSHRTLLAHLLKQIHHYKFKLKPQKLRFQLWYLIQILITMLFYHASSSFFLIVLTHTFLISSVVEQIFNPIAELAIPLEIPVKQRSKNRS